MLWLVGSNHFSQVHERGLEIMTSMGDLMGDTEPALTFSLRGLDMQERRSMVGESGMTVLDELEMSVNERRWANDRPRYTGVFSTALRLRVDSELWRAPPEEFFIRA